MGIEIQAIIAKKLIIEHLELFKYSPFIVSLWDIKTLALQATTSVYYQNGTLSYDVTYKVRHQVSLCLDNEIP